VLTLHKTLKSGIATHINKVLVCKIVNTCMHLWKNTENKKSYAWTRVCKTKVYNKYCFQ